MDQLLKYQSDHLFLLVGTNPLPNYVAAKLLRRSNGHVYLVHTDETTKIANRLISVLELELNNATKIRVKEAEGDNIFEQVAKYAKDKQIVGLNYTGGTKTMAVHAYRAVEHACPDAIFSYLDAASLKMVIEWRNEPVLGFPASLRVQPKIQTLLAMHGYSLKRDPVWEPFQDDLCRDLIRVSCRPWREWCDSNLRSGPGTSIRKKRDSQFVDLPVGPPFGGIARYWQGLRTLSDLATRWELDMEVLARWLDGIWLEHYTLWALRQIASECYVHQAGLSFKPKERDFEFDVAAMRGYQFFALSCTTESRKRLVKGKLFEAYIRARQMGGDEARVGLVCCAAKENPDSNPSAVQREIEESWDAKGKVRVFGAEDLPDLSAHLKVWFDSQPH